MLNHTDTGRIHFYKIIGKTEIWLKGVLIGKKDSFAPAELDLQLPTGEGLHQLNVIVQGEGDNKAGAEGNVVV